MKHRCILLVDDEQDVLNALRLSLQREPHRVLTATSAREALDIIASETVDVIVSDEQMPDMSGSAFRALVAQRQPQIACIVLTDQATVSPTTRGISEASVFRHLQKPCPKEALIAAIDAALDKVAKAERRTGFPEAKLRKLTSREREVFDLVSAGLRVTQVATALFISKHTVDNHLKSIFRKLGVKSQADLVADD